MSSGSPPPITNQHVNRLIEEKSPYLLQHAHNPVDWFPWGEDAFDKARAEDKLVLVSIGYATCHWCHVMERESFEDESLAGYLNEHFVAIKVDREERPDVDKIYMDALHALGQQGGWPLNMFTTPDGRPVTGGTYFPPQDGQGRKGFRTVLETIHGIWRNNREDLLQNAEAITEHLRQQAGLVSATDETWDQEGEQTTQEILLRAFDPVHGGFKLQPQNKFPPSMGLMLLLRHHRRTGDEDSLGMVEHTLKMMVSGGIYDHLGGGLSRYSTDYEWLVPHFEKMLYDNALFMQALTEAFLATGKAIYQVYAKDVAEYIARDMTSPEGAFYSAEDADSEGEEGKFYVWRPEELDAALSTDQAAAAKAYWDVQPGGNFEHGASILHAPRPLGTVAAELALDEGRLATLLQECRERLLARRGSRVRPLRDDKVLTSWNGLMISALARAGRAFANPEHSAAALRAGQFIMDRLRGAEGRLLRRYRDGEARFKAYLVDYAQMALACLDLYEATFDPAWFARARELMDSVNRLFRNENGPYFDTGSDAEHLLARNMEGYDGVEPSGNSSAAMAFLRLHAYGVRAGYDSDALRIFSGFRENLLKAGMSFPAMLNALTLHLAPPREVAIVGDPEAPETQALLDVVNRGFHPAVVLACAPPERVRADGEIVPLLEGRQAIAGRPTAYVCQGMVCQLPVHTPEELARQLER